MEATSAQIDASFWKVNNISPTTLGRTYRIHLRFKPSHCHEQCKYPLHTSNGKNQKTSWIYLVTSVISNPMSRTKGQDKWEGMTISRYYRSVAVASATALLFSSSFGGFYAASEAIGSSLSQLMRGKPGHFTDSPRAAYLGSKPGKSKDRGGLWSKQALDAAAKSKLKKRNPRIGLYVWDSAMEMAESFQMPPMHTLAVYPQAGSSLPWEGSFGGVNSGNGNKTTSLNLFSWKTRGGMSVDFTLFHNSQTSYNDELGHGWTWTYDIYINHSGATATVHHGDGTAIPFTDPDYTSGGGEEEEPGGGSTTGTTGSGSDAGGDGQSKSYQQVQDELEAKSLTDNPFTAPTGIFDELVQHTDGTWTLTKKDGTELKFNDDGFLEEIEDRNGNAITIALNGANYATRVTDATGRYFDIDLDGSNNFESVTSPDGKVWTFTRNGSDDLVEVEWPELDSTTYTDEFAYSSHRIVTHTDKRGKDWTFTYNMDGSLATEKNPYNHTWTYIYASTYSEIENPLGKKTRHNYSSGKLASVVDEASYSTSQTLGAINKPTSVTDKRGKTWTYTYDAKGNVLTKTNPLSKTWEYTYDGDNNVLTAEDPLGNITEYTYDANGNLTDVEDPLNRATAENVYDAYGQLLSVENALGKITEFAYDAHGNLETIEDPLTHTTTLDYDVMGRLTSTTDALSNVESVAYDEWGRPVTYTHPGSVTSLVAYDAESNTTATTNELGKVTSYVYDNAGRLTSTTNAESETESYAYNNAGYRTSVTNGRGKTRTYTYTDRGEVATLTLPDSSVEAWSYNGSGATSAYTNPLSQVIYYAYDDAGRQTGIDYPTGTDVSFSYDHADKRTGMTDSTGSTGWTYNAASELTGFNSPQGNLTYTYTSAGQRATMVDGGLTTTYTYDDAGRLTNLENGYSEDTAFVYDNANRLTQQTFDTGQKSIFGYDARGRQTSVDHKTSANAVLSEEDYVYDDGGNLTSKTVNSVTTTYTYDDIDQLLSESRTGYSASYTYDANGNRASKTLGGVTEVYTNDDADKLTEIKVGGSTVKSFGYDTAGRTTSVVTGAGTTTVAYDYEGRISTITYPSTATNTFTYNGLDTRVSKVDSAGTATYKRDGAHVTAPVIGDGSAVYTPGISERRSSTSKFYGSDRLGTNSVETNTSQAVIATKTYDAFGMPVASTGSSASPFGFAGQSGYQEDVDSGLKLLGHRYYDASTGRFLTRDPIQDGRNWYTYTNNNPTQYIDPNGHEMVTILLIGAAALFIAGLVRGASEAQEIIDEGKENRENMDEDFGEGDDKGYEEGMREVERLNKEAAEYLKEGIEDQYIYGVPGKIAGEAAETVTQGGSQAVEVTLTGAREMWDLITQEIENAKGGKKK